jgi:multisubunit Na+/H+ antiporter MnhB subunit
MVTGFVVLVGILVLFSAAVIAWTLIAEEG